MELYIIKFVNIFLGKIIGGVRVKHFKIIVVGGLCASLLTNYILLTKLDEMDNKINNISGYQHQVISTVNSQVGNINNTINEIKEEQSWLSAVNVETIFSDVDKNSVVVSFEWQVKELQSNSEVLFNYRMGEDKDYKSIQVEDKGNGVFGVVMMVDVKPEPTWHIQVSSNNMSKGQMEVIEEKKEALQMKNRVNFNYFISVSHGEILKSSDINIARIDDIGVRYYGYLVVHTDINKNNNYSLSVMSEKMHDTSAYLKEVYIKKYSGGQLVDEEKLVKENVTYEDGTTAREDPMVFNIKPSEEKMDFSSLVLKVVYSDGSVFEREVYSK